MPIERVISPDVTEPPEETWSNCLVVDGVCYIAGLTARAADFNDVPGGDEYVQAKAIFTKMKTLVEAAGGTMADVVKVVIYVTDIRNRDKVWKARREFFSGNFPTSTLIEISHLAASEMNVEIEAIAHLGKGKR